MPRPIINFRRARIAFLAGLIAVSGCSSGVPLYAVSGTVKYKGHPIEFGTISFRSDADATAAVEIKDGRYLIPAKFGLPAGQYRVAVTYPDPKVPRFEWKPGDPPGDAIPAKEMLPAKYHAKSVLTAEVKPQSDNDISFDLN